MTLAETLGLIASFGSLTVSAVALIPLARQIRQATRENEASHVRARKQATMEYLAGTLDRLSVLRERGVPDHRDKARVEQYIDLAIRGDGEKMNLILGYLTVYNMLGVACANDAFDIRLVDQTWGGTIIAVHENYATWIQHMRKTHEEPRLYEDLDWLAANVTQRRIPTGSAAANTKLAIEHQATSTPSTSTISTPDPASGSPSNNAPELTPGTVRT